MVSGSLTIIRCWCDAPSIEATQNSRLDLLLSFSNHSHQGDAISTIKPTTGQVGSFYSHITSTGSKDGDISRYYHTVQVSLTLTAGGAGTVATGQFVNELTIN